MARKWKGLLAVMSLGLILALAGPAQAVDYVYTSLDYPGASETRVYGIDGTNIVGGYYSAGTGGSGYNGFVYDGLNWSSLDYPGAGASFAWGIDGANIVGWHASYGGAHAFLYDGVNWSSLDYPGASDTFA